MGNGNATETRRIQDPTDEERAAAIGLYEQEIKPDSSVFILDETYFAAKALAGERFHDRISEALPITVPTELPDDGTDYIDSLTGFEQIGHAD